MEQTIKAEAVGRRSWFGTFTLSPDWQIELLRRARVRHGDPNATWWGNPHCEERFRLVSHEMYKEIRKYWRRLRHAGCNFKYFLVFEPHKSGLPHAHFLLHEEDGTILKRTLRSQWLLGHFQASLVGGRARNAAAPQKAAWYVAKYLSKHRQARVKASPGYRPAKRNHKRPKDQSDSVN